MKKGNAALAGVAAVVIVICLIFSYIVYFDDGDGSGDDTSGYGTDTLRTEVVPGDYYVMEVTSEYEGEQTVEEVISVAVDVDGDMVLAQTGYGAPMWMEADRFANVLPEDAVPLRTEVIDTAFGERECQVYEDADTEGMYFWYSNGCIYRIQTEMFGIASVGDVVENTLYSDAPTLPEPAQPVTVDVGDWMEFDTYIMDSDGTMISMVSDHQEVVSVDGDEVTVHETQDGVDIGYTTYPISVFLSGIDPTFTLTSVGSSAMIYDGEIVGCEIVEASYDGATITAYQYGVLTLLAIAEVDGLTGLTGMIYLNSTSLI